MDGWVASARSRGAEAPNWQCRGDCAASQGACRGRDRTGTLAKNQRLPRTHRVFAGKARLARKANRSTTRGKNDAPYNFCA